eukprot:gene17059-35338_t
MPGMDGVALAGHIRSLGMPKVPQMLMVTAYGREDVMRAARAQGIETVLIKPVNASLLFDTLMQPLEASGSERRRAATPAPAVDELPLDIRGASVLLVEDNELNQMVAMELLLDAGFAVDVAENGQIAIDHIERKHYDAVLMDMQMPVMDGETATRLLRGNPRYAQLPIIAMTANAMASDREASLQAGMNDHVGKPFDLSELVRTIQRHAPPTRERAAPAGGGVPAAQNLPADAIALARMHHIDLNAALHRMGGSTKAYARFLARFVDDHPRQLAELKASVAAGDFKAGARVAHTLKGLAGTLGITALVDLGFRAEKALAAARQVSHGDEPLRLLEGFDPGP